MAATLLSASFDAVPLVAATPKTVINLQAAANQRVKILGFTIGFDGISSTASPVKWRLIRQSGGTGVGTAVTPSLNESELTLTPTTLFKKAFSAEPTAGAVLDEGTIPPQSGMLNPYPFAQEFVCAPGQSIGLELTGLATTAVNAYGSIRVEE